MHKIFIDGSAGTTGLRIKQRLQQRNDIELLELPEELRKNEVARTEISNASDLVFLCLSDNIAKLAVPNINSNVKIIDASTAHRCLDNWVYGMPELCNEQRNKIRNAKRVANCGCHATGFIALVRPLIKKGIISKDYPIVAHSITGYSGGGKKMIADYENTNRSFYYNSPCQYALLQDHKHIVEMQKYSLLDNLPSFQPIVADFYSGMSVTVPLNKILLSQSIIANDLLEIYKEYYHESELINIENKQNTQLPANKLSGFDDMKISAYGKDNFIVNACFDNLGKGASGTAIQNMNLMLDVEETTGLLLSDKEK
ncbi:MAG: N-acetyl-gamma-glutamyl-phosphate reductase [Clostridia bacterium]